MSTVATQPSQSTAVASAQSKKRTFQELVEGEQFKSQLIAALPKHLTPDRFIRVLLTATMKTPLLLQCSQESMFKGILDAAAAGVEVDGRRAHLIPYKNNSKNCYEAQLIIDYKGIAELIMRSGLVSTIHAEIVCENDVFEENRGQVVKHTIDRKKERGAMYAAYALIVMRDGGEKCEVMSKSDIDAIRKRSRAGSSGPWVTDYNEMAKKTVFRRASKWVPLSPEIRSIVESDDAIDIDSTPIERPTLSALLGNAVDTSPPVETTDDSSADAPTVETKTYTAEERATILKEVETLMLDHSVGEAKVMLYVHEKKLAREGQDEVATLSTDVLDGLRAVIPALKKK